MVCKSQPVKVGENARHSHAEYIPQTPPHPPPPREKRKNKNQNKSKTNNIKTEMRSH